MGFGLKFDLLVLLVSLLVKCSLSQADDILTDKGEVAIDYSTGKLLPEELDDGELEGGDHHIEWTYSDQHGWSHEYPICDGPRLRQSPIDIDTDTVTVRPGMRLEFYDYNQDVEFHLKNSHHSVSINPIASLAVPTVAPNWLTERVEFELNEIHFHWGDGINKGSEHEINGQRAAAEMHMVHYKKGIDKADLGNVDNSVLVIGVLIESDRTEHMDLEHLVENVKFVNGTDEEYTTIGSPKNLFNLLPKHYQSFYTYNGSLTTPPCYEVVSWVVMSEPVYLSNDRLIELSNLEANLPGKGRMKIAANRRDLQPLMARPIFASNNILEESPEPVLLSKDPKFADAFKEFWFNIKNIKGSLRKAYSKIAIARDKLVRQMRMRGAKTEKNSVE